MAARVLIVDDQGSTVSMLEEALVREGYVVSTANSAEEAVRVLKTQMADVMVADIRMPEKDGLELLNEVKSIDPDLPVILMTAFGSYETALQAGRAGACEYMTKPVNLEQLRIAVARSLRERRLLEKTQYLEKQLEKKASFEELVGHAAAMNQVHGLIDRIAASDTTVLIEGESGTGKELAARAIHRKSARSRMPFVAVDCSALTETLLESELFGHVKGAFTGAVSNKKGLLQVADGGTLFLDEVGGVNPSVQAKLMRAIEEREIKPVGSTQPLKVDIRLITASNKRLEGLVEKGLFREDLFYRLNVVTLRLPPLRDRKEDIPLLVEHFLKKYATVGKLKNISAPAVEYLKKCPWRGNVRELENCIQRAVALTENDEVGLEDVVGAGAGPDADEDGGIAFQGANLDEVREQTEKHMIESALRKTEGSQTRAAELLGIKVRSLRYKMQKYGLSDK